MSILDQTSAPVDQTGTVAQAVSVFRREILLAIELCESATTCMEEMCTKHTRSAIDTELGGDSTAFANIYASMETLLESAEVGKTIPSLPV